MSQTQLIIPPKLKHKVNKYVNIVNVVLFTKPSIDNADTKCALNRTGHASALWNFYCSLINAISGYVS